MKMSKTVIIAIVAIAAVAIVIVAAVLLMGMSSLVFLHNGDNVTYGINGVDANGNPLSGSVTLTINNVTSSGYDMKSEYTGLSIPTSTQHMSGAAALTTKADLGTKTQGGVTISTAFGNKTVDIYHRTVSNQEWTSYAGSNPLVQYRIDITVGSASMTLTLEQTNIEKVKTGNAA